MKIIIRGISLLLVVLTLLSLAACGGGNDSKDTSNNPMTTPEMTTPMHSDNTTPSDTTLGDDPMRPGDSTPFDTEPGTDPLLPDNTTPSDTLPMDTSTPSDTDTGTPADSGTASDNTALENASELLESAIKTFRNEPTIRVGRVLSAATVDGKTSESITSFRFERKECSFAAHSDSGSDTSDVIVVDDTAYVRIGDILKEKTTFTEDQYDTVLYSTTLSVLDALDVSAFSEIGGVKQSDGTARIVCHGISEQASEKLGAVLNTVNMDMSEVAGGVECVFLLDANGRIVEERCEITTTVGHMLRVTDEHTVDIRLLVEATCEYPQELTILPPDDAANYKEVEFRELFA
ncbi:MAG: hypothetical protein IJY12_02665 [Clostridia bacterium]|nr:hypothetical protein [Clostridia bacterium]